MVSPLTRTCKVPGARPWLSLELEQHICFQFLLHFLHLMHLHPLQHLEDEAEDEVEPALLHLLDLLHLLHTHHHRHLEDEAGPEVEDDEVC